MSVIQERQGFIVSCPEEDRFRMGYIEAEDLAALGREMDRNEYGRYLWTSPAKACAESP